MTLNDNQREIFLVVESAILNFLKEKKFTEYRELEEYQDLYKSFINQGKNSEIASKNTDKVYEKKFYTQWDGKIKAGTKFEDLKISQEDIQDEILAEITEKLVLRFEDIEQDYFECVKDLICSIEQVYSC